MSGFNPFPQAAPDFTDPLGLLRACHGRILSHCETLERLLSHLADKGADLEAAQAMERIHRYFSTSAQHHHEDEEGDLFPCLRGRSAHLDEIIGELEGDHRALAERWQALAPWLKDPLRASRVVEFAIIANPFVAAYRAHAAKENDGILRLATELLTPDELRLIGAAMARRRGVAHY